MDMRSWKKVLLQWVNECGFMDRNYFNIEQSDIDAFFQNFSLKHPKTANGKYKLLSDFLKEFYPKFEFHVDDENCLSSSEYIYIYSMLLHFSCVRHPETVFHEICQRLPEYAQQCIASFFKELIDIESLSKENLRHAIAHVVSTNLTPPRLYNESIGSNQSMTVMSIGVGGSTGANSSGGSLPSPTFIRCDSPLKTPKRCAGSQRISPNTPKSFLLEERTRELYNLRAQLETERYEKGLLEVQIKQNEDKILKLNQDHKKLVQQIQDLKNDILVKSSEGIITTNRDGDDQIRKRLLKEMSQKENELSNVSELVRTLQEEKSLVQEKLSYAEKQIVMCMNRITDLDFKVDELNDEIKKKNHTIKYLTESKTELEQIINESCPSSNTPNLNSSIDCFDSSFSRNIGNTNTSSNVNSPENLGSTVVDIQLREKEHENSKLKEELQMVKEYYKKLSQNLHELAEKQAKEFDIVIETNHLSISKSETEQSKQDTDKEQKVEDPLEQFNIFSNCMEKICSFHKCEKQKAKELEKECQQIKELNSELNKKMENLNQEFSTLQEHQKSLEEINEKVRKDNMEMQLSLDKCTKDIEDLNKQKEEISLKFQQTVEAKDHLSKELCGLRQELEGLQTSYHDLLENSQGFEKKNTKLLVQLEELQRMQMPEMIPQLELQVKSLTEKIGKQTAKIADYKKAEQAMKLSNEKLLIENEEMKKKSRDATNYMEEIKLHLVEKQQNISKLAKELTELTHQNKMLEEKIDKVIQEHEEENRSYQVQQLKSEEEIKTLMGKLNSIEIQHEEKQMKKDSEHERELRSRDDDILKLQNVVDETSSLIMEKTKENQEMQQLIHENAHPKLRKLLELLGINDDQESFTESLGLLVNSVENLHQQYVKTSNRLVALDGELMEAKLQVESLTVNLRDATEALTENEANVQEMAKLQQLCKVYESNIAKLNEMQRQFVETVKKDMIKKEQEFSERMTEASQEYESSLERIRVELKREKEYYINKERELLLVIANHNEVKKQLYTKEQEVEELSKQNSFLLEQNSKMKLLEERVAEYCEENGKLQYEIECFKREVHQNAIRLLEADNALSELMIIAKEQEMHKEQIEETKRLLEEKDRLLQQKINNEEDLNNKLLEHQECLTKLSLKAKCLEEDKEKLMLDVQDYVEQIKHIQEEKTMLLESLEKSADQLKLSIQAKESQTSELAKKYEDAKEQLENASLQNTKLQGELVEREAELRMGQEDHEHEMSKFQQIIEQMQKQLSESSEQIETFDMALMEILAIMENNFNLARNVSNSEEIENIFNVPAEAKADEKKEAKLFKLRGHLNLILHFDNKLQNELQTLNKNLNETSSSMDISKKLISDLQYQVKTQNVELADLRDQLENEEAIVEKRVAHEIRRLEDDLQNLEKVNERLTNGNFELQMTMGHMEQDLKTLTTKLEKVDEENLLIKEEVESKSKLLEKLKQSEKKLQQTINEKTQQLEEITEKCKLLESQEKENLSAQRLLEKELQALKEKSSMQQIKITQQQQQLETLTNDQKKLNETLKQLQTYNDSLDNEVSLKNKEVLCYKNQISELQQSLQNSEYQLDLIIKKLDEMETSKLNAEAKCERTMSESQQLQRDMEFLRVQQQSASEESQRLTKEIERLQQDKQHLREEIRDTKADLQRANDNVSQLIQQISSIRLEKESVVDENNLLRKQLEDTGKHHSSSETKLKSIVEKSQDLERKHLASENELKSVKSTLEKCEANNERLTAENKKLRDSQETSTKRIEKLALKLGDSQARSTKLERDNEKLSKTLEANATTVEALQKEKDLLQNEAKSLKERVSRAERSHEHLVTKVQNLEQTNAQLQEIKQRLEASEIDGKSKLNKLEKMREAQEDKIRKLSSSLNMAENNNVKLNLEIGALNSQLQEARVLNTQEQLQELKVIMDQLQQESMKYEELTKDLSKELEGLQDEKSNLNDELSKAKLNLEITKKQCEKQTQEMEQLRAELLITRQEKSQFELNQKTSEEKLKNLEQQTDVLLQKRESNVASLEARITTLEQKLTEKCQEVDSLQHEIHSLQESSESNSALLQQQQSALNQTENIDQLRSKLSLADEALAKEKQMISQLKLDNQILHTKYQESKQKALEATKRSEERIKENRLELEGKLEKMKNKNEITKMKLKQEKEMALLKSDMEVFKTQNNKYEEHIRKLSNQIVRLNDNILEYQKENAILSTKLKHLVENHDVEKFKRPNSIHVSTISSSTGPVAAPNIGTNLAMEDEEGEVFNNTYLTDLKEGRMSEFMSREICAEELKYRNSLLPPHLKSSYAAQFDHDCPEDELKDGPHSMDDSMSALLSTTAGGTRKKCTGVTHYKRPGPPTPSKNGRLSFGGGNSEPAREILKESFDSNGAVSSSKTPARFNFFASRFSMGNGKDEKFPVKRERNESNLRKDIVKGNHEKIHKNVINEKYSHHASSEAVCTSTPRKSNSRFDQRRLISQLLVSSPSPSPLLVEHKDIKKEKKIMPLDFSMIETPVTTLTVKKEKLDKASSQKRMEAIATGLKNKRRNSSVYGRRLSRRLEEICTPTSGETTSSAATGFSNTPKDRRLMRRQTLSSLTTTTSGGRKDKNNSRYRRLNKKDQQRAKAAKPRPSLHLRGTMFVKYRNPSRGTQHDANRYRSRKQRNDNFNQGRNIKGHKSKDFVDSDETDSEEDEETMIKNLTYDIQNNNYGSTYNRNDQFLGKTIIVKKGGIQNKEDIFESHNTDSFVTDGEEEDIWNPFVGVYEYDHEEEEEEEDDDHDIYDSEEYDTHTDPDYNSTKDISIYRFDKKYDIKFKHDMMKYPKKEMKEEICKQELVTSFDLEEFDRFISKTAALKENQYDIYSSFNGSSEHFEKLLLEKESSAPFRIKHIHFDFDYNQQQQQENQQQQRQSVDLSFLEPFVSSSEMQSQHDISMATPHFSSGNETGTPGNLSRTIYGGTVIYNRRIPNINTTYVRKSSIYIKNNHDTSSGCNDVVLITNQTITVVDLVRMWKQMDSSTRCIVGFAALASFTTLLGLFLSFTSKR